MDFDLDKYYDASEDEGEADVSSVADPLPEDTPMTLLPLPVNEDYYRILPACRSVGLHHCGMPQR